MLSSWRKYTFPKYNTKWVSRGHSCWWLHSQSMNIFLKNRICRTWVLFVGPLIPLFLDFWWCLLWVSKPKWAALSALGGGIHFTHSLRFTSGVTPADLLAASMTAEPISSIYLEPGIGGDQTGDLSLHRWMLYWLSYAGQLANEHFSVPQELYQPKSWNGWEL